MSRSLSQTALSITNKAFREDTLSMLQKRGFSFA